MAGLTNQGFTPKTQAEIKSDMEAKLRAYFGDDLNLSVGSRFGTLVDIFSFEVADTWLALQGDYNSRFRNTATGVNLDNVATLTNARENTTELFGFLLYWRPGVQLYLAGCV